MTTLITLGGILVLLGLGFWWAVDTGKRLNQAKSLRERVDKVANVNEFNRREDEEVNRQTCNAVQSIGRELMVVTSDPFGYVFFVEKHPVAFKTDHNPMWDELVKKSCEGCE